MARRSGRDRITPQCLLGVFLPVIIKYGDTLATGRSVWKLWMSYLSILLDFRRGVRRGLPRRPRGRLPVDHPSLARLHSNCRSLYARCDRALSAPHVESPVRVQQWGVLITPDLARQKTQDKRKTAINTRLQAAKWRKDAVERELHQTEGAGRAQGGRGCDQASSSKR